MSVKTRQDIVPTINDIVAAIQKLLITQTDGVLVSSAFKALRSIGLTLCAGEESCITTIIPQILEAIKKRAAAPSALAALSPLPCVSIRYKLTMHLQSCYRTKLGPRIILYFREIISQCVALLREGSAGTPSIYIV